LWVTAGIDALAHHQSLWAPGKKFLPYAHHTKGWCAEGRIFFPGAQRDWCKGWPGLNEMFTPQVNSGLWEHWTYGMNNAFTPFAQHPEGRAGVNTMFTPYVRGGL
jgi:hypothetical protein